MAPWTNAVLLRVLVRNFTQGLARNEYRLRAQLDDAARSVVANIEEGYKRPTTKEYLSFLGYSQASLEEVKGDIRRACQDGFLKSRTGSSLAGIGIDLREIRGTLRDSKGILRGPPNASYNPLISLKASDLTLEVFMELINKTDYLLRQLVGSLEKKMNEETPMSNRDKWLKAKMMERSRGEKEFDEELKKKIQESGKNPWKS